MVFWMHGVSGCELPVGAKIELVEVDTVTVSDVAQVHETAVDIPDVSLLLVPVELIILCFDCDIVVLDIAVLVF